MTIRRSEREGGCRTRGRIAAGIALLVFAALTLWDCAGIPVSNIPSPQPGLVLFINRNEHARGQVLLFEPGVHRDNLFVVSGRVFKLQSRPVLQFRLPSAPGTNIPAIGSAVLYPGQSYSLVVLWENNVGQFIKFTYGGVVTSERAFNQSYTDFLGREFWADQIIYLPAVSPAESQGFGLQVIPLQ